jgi:DNA-binding CsgD family transcriptional regulator
MRFRLPRVSISFGGSREVDPIPGEFSILAFGFAIHQTWIYASMFGANRIFGDASVSELTFAFGTQGISAVTFVFLISIITFAVCLLFASFTDQKFLRFYVSKRVLIGSALLSSVGTSSIFASGLGGIAGACIIGFAGVSTGIGSALLILYWGTAFSRNSGATIILNTAVAIALAITLYAALLYWIPSPISGIITSLLPLSEACFLWKLTPIPYSKRHEVPIFNPLGVRRASFVLRFGIPVFIFGIPLGALRSASTQLVLPISSLDAQLLVLLAAGIAVLLTLISAFAVGVTNHIDLLFRSTIPFIVVSIVFMLFFQTGHEFIGALVLLAGYLCFEALMWIFFGELSQEFRLSPIFLFGLGRGMLAIGSLMGTYLFTTSAGTELTNNLGQTGWLILVLLTMVLAYSFLPREQEIRNMVSPNSSSSRDAIAQINERMTAHHTEGGLQDNLAGGNLEPANANRGRFRVQCELVADQYLLSRRETEVLFFLAKGHNAAYIQDKLYISKSTAKTHINHIYHKLDIHTQQELLAIVEAARSSVPFQ